jgi:TatA/E family protein of Tat protein translocase
MTGHWEIIIIGLIFVLLFVGPKKLPGLGKSLGESIRNQ